MSGVGGIEESGSELRPRNATLKQAGFLSSFPPASGLLHPQVLRDGPQQLQVYIPKIPNPEKGECFFLVTQNKSWGQLWIKLTWVTQSIFDPIIRAIDELLLIGWAQVTRPLLITLCQSYQNQGAWMTLENPGTAARAGTEAGEAQRSSLFNNAWTFTLPVYLLDAYSIHFIGIPKLELCAQDNNFVICISCKFFSVCLLSTAIFFYKHVLNLF